VRKLRSVIYVGLYVGIAFDLRLSPIYSLEFLGLETVGRTTSTLYVAVIST